MRRILVPLFCSAVALIAPARLGAQEPGPLDALSKQVEALTKALEEMRGLLQSQGQRLEALEQENNRLKARPPAAAPQPLPPQPLGQPGRAIKTFNPEIGLVVDIQGAVSQSAEDAEGNDKFSVRELELVIGHDIDPYGRFDSTITFSDFEDVTIEEAYITYWDLPWEIQARVGRIRPQIGKATAVHRDQLDTVDEPLVIQRYLGVEGLFRTGVEFSRFLPQPLDIWTPEFTVGVMEGGVGEDGTLFGESRRRPSFYAHLKNFFTISPVSDFELGLTSLLGSEDANGNNDVSAVGFDATAIHRFSPDRRVKIQSELYAQFRDQTPDRTERLFGSPPEDDPFGFYTLVDMRLTRKWGFGTRYDYVELVDNLASNPRDMDRAYTGYVSFFQSEFARLRLQYQHARLASGENDDRFILQGTYAIGVHKHRLK